MEIPLYLAMTATEMQNNRQLPHPLAWLSVLFSPYGRGLSNIPKALPPDSLLILSDRTPILGHDPELIFSLLQEAVKAHSCCGVLLDFERPGCEEAAQIVKVLSALPCPLAVSAPYADPFDCAVFVPSPLPSESLDAHLKPWDGREIWLEISAQAERIVVSATDVTHEIRSPCETLSHTDPELNCHYTIELQKNAAVFTLQRNLEDWRKFLSKQTSHNIQKAVGLYQEMA